MYIAVYTNICSKIDQKFTLYLWLCTLQHCIGLVISFHFLFLNFHRKKQSERSVQQAIPDKFTFLNSGVRSIQNLGGLTVNRKL